MSNFTGNKISDTYQRLLQLSSSGEIADGTGSLVNPIFNEIKFSDGTIQLTAGGGASGGGVFVNKGGGTFELTESVSTLKIGAPLIPSDGVDVTIGSQAKPFKEVFVDSGSLVIVSGSESSKIQFLDKFLQFDSDISASITGELIGTSSFSTTAASAESSSFSTTAQTAETAETADTADVATTAQNAFATMSAEGQTNVLADSTHDTLNFSGSSNISIITDATTDTFTFDLKDDIVVKTLTAETYIVSSSVSNMTTNFSSGSTKFGDTTDDTHQFTGSVLLGTSSIDSVQNITASGNITVSGDIFSGGKTLQAERTWNQQSLIVDYEFINSRTASLESSPINHSENVYFNGLRLTKDSGSFEFDYSMSLNDKHIIFSSDITFKSGDFITFQYQYEN